MAASSIRAYCSDEGNSRQNSEEVKRLLRTASTVAIFLKTQGFREPSGLAIKPSRGGVPGISLRGMI